jgi:hypothetical protein
LELPLHLRAACCHPYITHSLTTAFHTTVHGPSVPLLLLLNLLPVTDAALRLPLAAPQARFPEWQYRMVVQMSLGAPGPLTIEQVFFR